MKTSLSKLSFYNTLVSIIIFSAILASFIYMFSDNLYKQKVQDLEEKFYLQNKELVQREVERAGKNIVTLRDSMYLDAKEKLIQTIDIVKNLFETAPSSVNIAILLKNNQKLLDTIKWDNDTGYVYIFNKKGIILYHGANKKVVNKSVFEVAKHNEKLLSVIRNSISKGTNFGTYQWTKPNSKQNILYKKFVYIKKDTKHDIYIAAGIYNTELNKKILNIVRQNTYKNRFGVNNYGYIWMNDLDSVMKIHPLNKNLEGKNLTDLKTKTGQLIFKTINDKALEGGGFVQYEWYRPDNLKIDKKVSFVKLIDDWPFVIGSGFYLTELKDILQNEKNELKRLTNQYIKDVLTVLIFMIFIVIFITRLISNKIKKVEEERIEQLNMLEQYKLILDKSSVVSKANLDGLITYTNNKFKTISGYKDSEILGKPHNIVRHPDSTKEQFKDLWETILDGKVWTGIIKNKNKNEKTYFNSTTIVPIKDSKGKILEFISSGNDVTELFALHKEIEETQKEVIYKMGEIGETRSKETGNHVKRVAEYSKLLALLYGLDKHQADILFTASPMHDIGKVGIPDAILKKPAKLTTEEFEIMKTHAEIGYNILKNSKREVLKAASIVASEHHEKWDGNGYPLSLKGDDIHIFGRITALADVFDALGSIRCYKDSWSDEDIFSLFRKEKGKHFEPKLIDLFFENFDKFDEIRKKYKDK